MLCLGVWIGGISHCSQEARTNAIHSDCCIVSKDDSSHKSLVRVSITIPAGRRAVREADIDWAQDPAFSWVQGGETPCQRVWSSYSCPACPMRQSCCSTGEGQHPASHICRARPNLGSSSYIIKGVGGKGLRLIKFIVVHLGTKPALMIALCVRAMH